MSILDTDTLSHFFASHAKVMAKVQTATEPPVTSIVSRIEVLRGRFDSVLKAADGNQILIAQRRLVVAELDLAKLTIVSFDTPAAAEFDRLRQNKKLKKIDRADLLIASIALARQATLITRNLRDFQLVPGLRLENWID